jgi:hypothetical protein
VLETGHFTNSDTAINNFAGIAHYDGAASGSAFRNPVIGVRAQIQLLKKYALGNDAPLANPTSPQTLGQQQRRGAGSPGPGLQPRLLDIAELGLRGDACPKRHRDRRGRWSLTCGHSFMSDRRVGGQR